jgi:transposase
MTISSKLKTLILNAVKDGGQKNDVAIMFNVGLRTVQRICSKSVQAIMIGKRQKRNKMMNNQIKRAVAAVERKQIRVTSPRIKDIITDTVSTRTIRRKLSSLGLKYKAYKRKIILTEFQKKVRVNQVEQWITDKIDFDKVVFSDESRFTLDGNDSLRSWMNKNTKSQSRRPFQGGSVMVWGCMARCGLLLLRKIEGNINSLSYCKLMEEDVLPSLNEKLGSFIFQQDNARPHVSKMSLEMFERNDMTLLSWPPYSPDLSPIENIWAILKGRVYTGPQFSSSRQLWARIQKEVKILVAEKDSTFSRMYDGIYEKLFKIIRTEGNLM